MRGVSFEVARGEVFCLLGPNGAGKTSIVEILEGYRTRSGGEARVLGMDPAHGQRELHERVGIVLQQCGVQNDLTVAELIEMYGRYHAAAPPGRRADRAGRARREARHAGAEAVRRPAPAARPGAGAGRRSRPRLPGRADDRLRPGGAPPGLVDDPLAVRPGQDGVPDHPLHGRGAASGQPRRGDERRPDHRDGAARGARRSRPAAGRDPLLAAWRLVAGRPARRSAASSARSRATACSVLTKEPVVAAQRITTWALDHDVDLGHFSVSQPTLEDIYLELTGSTGHNATTGTQRPRRQFDERGGDTIRSSGTWAWSPGRSAMSSAPTGATAAGGSSRSCSR